MQPNYQPAIDRIIHKYEGGYGWNKKDPGGPTNFGVTCYDLAEHRGQKMASMSAWVEPVRNMPLAEAEAIYAAKYAKGIIFDAVPTGIDVCMLDYGINSGNARPIRVARAIVGLPAGGMDNALVNALVKVDPKVFVSKMCQERLRFMHAIRGGSAWAEFGHGWGSRVSDLEIYCDSIITAVPAPPAPDLTKVVTPKATNVGATAPKTTAGGTVATATTAHLAGFNWWYVGGAAVICIVGGIAYEAYHDIMAKRANELVHI